MPQSTAVTPAALLNLNGELIGINTAILAPGGGSIGIGFAIPSNMAKTLAQQLIQFGEIKRGLLGIKGMEMSADIAKRSTSTCSAGRLSVKCCQTPARQKRA
jgi:S1-C subfamily serine protease